MLLAVAGAGLAETTSHEIPVLAHEEAHDCVADQAPCLEVEDAAWSLVSEGDVLEIGFTNNGTQPHGLAVAPGAAAEEDPRPTEAAFLVLDPVDPGESGQAEAEVPNGTDRAYLFCHDEEGSAPCGNLTRNVYPAGSVEESRQRGPGLDDPDRTPTGPALAAVGLVVASLAVPRPR